MQNSFQLGIDRVYELEQVPLENERLERVHKQSFQEKFYNAHWWTVFFIGKE